MAFVIHQGEELEVILDEAIRYHLEVMDIAIKDMQEQRNQQNIRDILEEGTREQDKDVDGIQDEDQRGATDEDMVQII